MKRMLQSLAMLLLLLSMGFSQNQYFLEFDDTDDYVRYADDATLGLMDGATDYTIEAWIWVNDGWDTYDRVLQRYSLWRVYLNSNNRISFGIDTDGSNWAYYHSNDNVFNTNEWTHIAIIRNTTPDPNEFKIYINGVDQTSGTYSGYAMRNEADRNLYIGNDGSAGNYFNGYIDEVRIKNIAEDPANLHYHKTDLPYTSDANTAILFHFDEGTGSVTQNTASGTDASLGSTTVGDAAEPTWRVWNYNGSDLSLPVELNAFTAASIDGKVQLKWTTASEVDNQGFIIRRAVAENGAYRDLDSYQSNAALKGAGNSSHMNQYAFADNDVIVGQTYWYKLVSVDMNGAQESFGPISVTVNSADLDRQAAGTIPATFALYQNYPNPFNPSTSIRFDVPVSHKDQGQVKLTIYDVQGRLVKTVFSGHITAGSYRYTWNGTNEQGRHVVSGVYIYRLETPEFQMSRKMMLVE